MSSRALTAIVAASVASGGLLPAVVVDAASTPGWHVFAYIVNDSESQLPYGQDIDEMIEASRSGVDFTVYLDSSDQAGPSLASAVVPNLGDALLIEIADGSLEVTHRLGELDSGSPDTLAWFVAQGLIAHPTEHAALVIWDHGGGWNGVAFDEDIDADGSRRTSSLDPADVASGIGIAVDAAGRDRLDLVVFDACLMASFDTVAALEGEADYVIASEEVIPGLGLEYGSFDVFAQPGGDPDAIFDAIAGAYATEVATAQPSDADGFTLSMFDTSKMAALDEAVAAFGIAAAADLGTNPGPYVDATTSLHRYGVSGDYWFGFVDLGQYLNGLRGVSPAVLDARDQVLAALVAARRGQHNGAPGFDSATGLTVYFPTEPRQFDRSFNDLPSAASWFPFLDSFYNAQGDVVLQIDAGFAAATLSVSTIEANVYQIEVPVSASFTGSVELFAATSDPAGTRTYFESDMGEITEAGVATALIYPSLTTVSDGLRSVVPFTRYIRQPDGTHGYSSFSLRRANGSLAQLNWDRRADEGPFTVVDGNGVVAYTPQAGDLAYPVHVVQPPGGALEESPADVGLDPNRHWSVSDDPVPAGAEVYLELRLLDINGNVIDTVSGTLVAGQP